MTPRSGGGFPVAADDWLVPQRVGSVLAVGGGGAALARRLAARGIGVVMVELDADIDRRLPGITQVVASGRQLPFAPCSFDTVLLCQDVAVLDDPAKVSELARVLAPGGALGVMQISRDDSVPWVRRLAALLQAHDPELMTQRPLTGLDQLAGCCFFPELSARSFRLWAPTTRQGLLDMVHQAPRLAGLDSATSQQLLAAVEQLYDSSARDPEPLLLPYAVQCWRAEVDHSEFTSQLTLPADGLTIPL